mmetsp:Transcript_22614/g.40833  ORF Transcript_22614/g.40833 Transcript_22614/m.40833 type:complete len:747 (+) Transcript_22614:50-2290(+)
MVLRYSGDDQEVHAPKPRNLPPISPEAGTDRPSSSSGGSGEPLKPVPPAGPKPAGASPAKGRQQFAISEDQAPDVAKSADHDEDEHSEHDPAEEEAFKRREMMANNASQSRFETRKSLANIVMKEVANDPREFISHLYRHAEQLLLWKQMDMKDDEDLAEAGRTRTMKLTSRSSMQAISFDHHHLKTLNTTAFDKLEVEDGAGEDDDDDEAGEDGAAEVVLKSVKDQEAVVRRQSAFILTLPMVEADLEDNEDGKKAEEPGTGGSGGEENAAIGGQQGDGPGSAPDANMVVEAKAPAEPDPGPHPLKDLLLAKKVNLKEVRKVLESLKKHDLEMWMEALIDPHGKTPVPKPLVVAVAENNPNLVELLVEFGADVTAPFAGESMYKGWVKPKTPLLESVINRKGRFVGTMLADKLEKIEHIFHEATKAAAEQAQAKNDMEVDVIIETHDNAFTGRASVSYRFLSESVDSRHTQGHPKDVYEIMEHLGDGDTSTVWGGWHVDSKLSVAIKTEAKSDEAGIWDEINIMRKIRHKNISALYETFENEAQVFMVLELCDGGRLYDAVDFTKMETGDPQESPARHPRVLKQLANAVDFLHTNKICHRDVQLENFLLAEPVSVDKATLKLIDFTTAKEYSKQELVTKICTPIYVAREILTRRMEPYTEKVDIWSLGVLFYILFCGHPPFPGNTDFDILKQVKKAQWKFEPEQAWSNAPKEAMELIRQMIVPNAEDRLSAAEVLKHKFLADTTL